MPDFKQAMAGLQSRTDLPEHRAAATSLLVWHEAWLMRADFRRACLITSPIGIHWPAVRKFYEAGPPRASSSQMTVLNVALALAEDQFRFSGLGHVHRRRVAEAFAGALGWRLVDDVPEPGHTHPEFIPGTPQTCGACAREAKDEGRRS